MTSKNLDLYMEGKITYLDLTGAERRYIDSQTEDDFNPDDSKYDDDEFEPYDDRDDDGDFEDRGYSSTQQMWNDRFDDANEAYERGEIDEIQRAERRMGA